MPRLTAIKIDNTRASDQDVLLADGGCLFLPTIGIKEARAKAAHIVAVERGTARVTVTAERIA